MSKIVHGSYVHVSVYVMGNIPFEGLTFTDNLLVIQCTKYYFLRRIEWVHTGNWVKQYFHSGEVKRVGVGVQQFNSGGACTYHLKFWMEPVLAQQGHNVDTCDTM